MKRGYESRNVILYAEAANEIKYKRKKYQDDDYPLSSFVETIIHDVLPSCSHEKSLGRGCFA